MSFFKNYRTPFGYVADGNQVDAYGVDHSGFSTRDEVEYQFERKEVWNWNGINTLPSEIRGFVFDHGIRTSPQNAIETTHQALNIDPVGDIIGKMTLSRLKNIDYDDFLHRYQENVKKTG